MDISLKARGKTTPINLSREQIESQFGQTLDEAAQKLNVSVSTLKRKCKDKGINWPGKDHLKKNQSIDKARAIQGNIEGTSSNENIVTIKAEYNSNLIKFTLPISSATFEVIEKEIMKRFALNLADYKLNSLKYFDDDDKKWFLFTDDKDVTSSCIKNKKTMLLLLENKFHSRSIKSIALFP